MIFAVLRDEYLYLDNTVVRVCEICLPFASILSE